MRLGRECRRERHERTRHDLGREEEREGHASQPRPAQLSVPDLRGMTTAERLLEGRIHEMHMQAGVPDDLRCRGVLGDVLRQRRDPASRLKEVATP